MKTTKNALLSLILVIIMLLTASCTNPGSGDTTSSDDVSETPEVSVEETVDPDSVVILDENETDYTVIRPEGGKASEIQAASSIHMTFSKIFGENWDRNINDDWIKDLEDDATYTSDATEILVGYTNRVESREVHATLERDQYVVKFVNNKLVIIGYDEYSTAAAATDFLEKYVNNADGTALAIPKNILIEGESPLRKIAVNEEASYRIMTWNLGCDVGVANDAITVILKYLPDILCLQETNKASHQKVVQQLPDYFKVATEFHSNGSTYVYTPIVYNDELFTLKDADVEWLDGRYTGTNTKSLAWAVFEDKQSGETFAVINFHGAVCSADYKGFENLTSAERNAQALAWRIDNVRQILERKDEIIKKHGNIPTMVTGDCNFKINSEPYTNLTNAGFVDAEFSARISKVTGYTTSFSYGSTFKSGDSIDHIFQLNDIDFVVHNIVRDSEVLTASDHCPVYTDFNIKKK